MANPVQVVLNAPVGGVVTCIANASYYQEVTVQFPQHEAVVFRGTGEEVAMQCQTGNAYQVPPSHEDYTVTLTFMYSTSGAGGPFQMANVNTPIINKEGGFVTITIMSEDSTDNDNNDSYLTISYMTRS